MSSFGRFLEFSVRTPDIIESLSYYKLIGFTEREIGDVWSHKYAVVGDGILNIGLHDRVFDAPSITFVQQDLARRGHVPEFAADAHQVLVLSFAEVDKRCLHRHGAGSGFGHDDVVIKLAQERGSKYIANSLHVIGRRGDALRKEYSHLHGV